MGQAKQRKLAGTYPVQTPKGPRTPKGSQVITGPEMAAALLAYVASKKKKQEPRT